MLMPSDERLTIVGEPVDSVTDRPDPDAVDPAAEIRRRGDVGRDGDDPSGDFGYAVRQVDEQAPERLLGGRRTGVLTFKRDWNRDSRGRRVMAAVKPLGDPCAQPSFVAVGIGRSPRVVGVRAETTRLALRTAPG